MRMRVIAKSQTVTAALEKLRQENGADHGYKLKYYDVQAKQWVDLQSDTEEDDLPR